MAKKSVPAKSCDHEKSRPDKGLVGGERVNKKEVEGRGGGRLPRSIFRRSPNQSFCSPGRQNLQGGDRDAQRAEAYPIAAFHPAALAVRQKDSHAEETRQRRMAG